MKKQVNHKSLNAIFLVGEIVDVGYMPTGSSVNVRARIKMRTNRYSFTYVDVYGRKRYGETMTLTCQVGNIVYVEGEFRNYRNEQKTYVLASKVECLFRRKQIKTPTTSIIKLLDNLDPIGYVPRVKIKKKEN